ncbi:unnamed protein product [Sympodiomycopsis kandeliae]
MTPIPLGRTSGGYTIQGMSPEDAKSMYNASFKCGTIPSDDFLRKALTAIPLQGATGVHENLDRAAPSYSPEVLERHSIYGGLQLRIASSDTGERYYWSLGEEEIFGPEAVSSSRGHIAMLFNSILKHLTAYFFHERTSGIANGKGRPVYMPNWASACDYIRFCSLELPLKSLPARAGFEKADHHQGLIVAYTLVNYPYLVDESPKQHLPEGKWRRTELVALHRQTRPKELTFRQALGYVVLVPLGTLSGASSVTDQERRVLHELSMRLKVQNAVSNGGEMYQFSMLHDGKIFVLLQHHRSGSIIRYPPVDPVKQPIDFMKIIGIFVFGAVMYASDEDAARAELQFHTYD